MAAIERPQRTDRRQMGEGRSMRIRVSRLPLLAPLLPIIVAAIAMAVPTRVLAQAGTVGGAIGKQNKSVSGGGEAAAPRARQAKPKPRLVKSRPPQREPRATTASL